MLKKYFPRLKEPLWSITAVSLLSIIIEVTSPFDVDHSAVDNAVKAHNQAYSLMKLVDCLDNVYVTVDFFGSANLEAFIISKASLVGRRSINQSYEKRKGKREESGSVVTVEAAVDIIRKKVEAAERYLREKHMLEEVPSAGALGADWLRIAQSYADYKLCKLILEDEDCYSSVEELRKKLVDSLRDVISSCVLQLPHFLLNSCKGWLADFAEEKINQAAKMLGTARGVIDAATRIQGTP
ncbi:hypothetical protein SUGI_0140980 [Cryptomeria japonica]|nr:hypothetical protein SUGI_0140980 [Cryptomeria japonica]